MTYSSEIKLEKRLRKMEINMNKKFNCAIFQVCFWALMLTCFATLSSFAQPASSRIEKSNPDDLICWWSFNKENGHYVIDEIQQKKDSVFGSFSFVPGIDSNAIKLDGFRTYIKRDQNNQTRLTGAFTVEAWIALASYPWSWSPVIDCSSKRLKGFFFGIDQEGHVGFKIGAGSSWYEATTKMNIPLREWTHVAAVFEPDRKISLYINGKEAAAVDIKGSYIPERYGSLTIGRNRAPQTWDPKRASWRRFDYLDSTG